MASTLSIGVVNPDDGTVPGFNIDGMVSTVDDEAGCFIEDFTSPDGEMGIDNQLATLAPTLEAALSTNLQETIDGAIADGDIIILMTVNDLDTVDDDSVTLDLALGAVPEGGTIELDGTALAAGQTFDPGTTYVTAAPANVEDGVLTVTVSELPLAIPIDATTTAMLTIRDASVRATVAGDPSPALNDGLIGGSLNIEELIATVQEIEPSLPPDTIRGVLEPVADLVPDADGICQNVSVGITFRGVEANVNTAP